MNVLFLLLLASLLVALVFLAGFVWASKTGQFDDTCTPALRILMDEEPAPRNQAVLSKDKSQQ